MKSQPFVTSLLLIACLVFTQVTGVFASEQTECSMAQMSDSTMTYALDSEDDAINEKHSSDLIKTPVDDCCEDAQAGPCCFDDCKCTDALLSFAFISTQLIKSSKRLAQRAIDDSSFALLPPQIQRLQRPPIHSFS
jgi:hypothetical protein